MIEYTPPPDGISPEEERQAGESFRELGEDIFSKASLKYVEVATDTEDGKSVLHRDVLLLTRNGLHKVLVYEMLLLDEPEAPEGEVLPDEPPVYTEFSMSVMDVALPPGQDQLYWYVSEGTGGVKEFDMNEIGRADTARIKAGEKALTQEAEYEILALEEAVGMNGTPFGQSGVDGLKKFLDGAVAISQDEY